MSPSLQTMGFFMSDINFCNTKEQLNHLGEVVTGKVDGSPTGADIDTSTLPYTGQVRKTLPALEGEYEQSITDKEAEADATINSYRLLNKGPYASGITLESKFEYITYNGESYFAVNPPYTTTATTPDSDSNLFVGGYTTIESVASRIGNRNLLSNSNFLTPSPDSITHPNPTPESYPAGTQIFSGIYAGASGVTVTLINGRVNCSAGDYHLKTDNTKDIERVPVFTSSVSDYDGSPTIAGVSHSLIGGEYIVTVTPAAGDVFSVKLEQGGVATMHPVEYGVVSNYSTTPRTLIRRFADSINVEDFGAVGDGVADDTLAIQRAIDFAKTYWDSVKPAFITGGGGMYRTTAPLNVSNTVDVRNALRVRDLNIVNETNGYIFTGNFWSDDFYFTECTFKSTPGAGTTVFDGNNLIRVHTTNCTFNGIDCAYRSDTVSPVGLIAIQSYRSIGDTFAGGGSDYVLNSANAITLDVSIDNATVEHRKFGIAIIGEAHNVRITNSVIENIEETALRFTNGGSVQSCLIQGNYFEYNAYSASLPDSTDIVFEENSAMLSCQLSSNLFVGGQANYPIHVRLPSDPSGITSISNRSYVNGIFDFSRVTSTYGAVLSIGDCPQGGSFPAAGLGSNLRIIPRGLRNTVNSAGATESLFLDYTRVYKAQTIAPTFSNSASDDFLKYQSLEDWTVDMGVTISNDDIVNVRIQLNGTNGLQPVAIYTSGTIVKFLVQRASTGWPSGTQAEARVVITKPAYTTTGP